MPGRQTLNVSLPPQQDRFVREQVESGRYRTASEVVRDGLRLLEESEHRRLLERWIYRGLTDAEMDQLPEELRQRARAHFEDLVDQARRTANEGRPEDGSSAMRRLRDELEPRSA